MFFNNKLIFKATLKRKQTEHERQYNELSERYTAAIAQAERHQTSIGCMKQQISQRDSQLESIRTSETKLTHLVDELNEKIEQERTKSRMSEEQHAIDVRIKN